MLFFFKPSTITVDCFCSDEIVFNNFKPDRANKFVPKYWKSLNAFLEQPASGNPQSNLKTQTPTLKKCNGFTDLFANGFIIPSWADFQIEMLKDGKYITANHNSEEPNTTFNNHSRLQFGFELYKNSTHIKIESPWLLKEKTGVKFAWNSCTWHNSDNLENFYILSAVVDYRNQSGTNINAFQRKNTIVKFYGGDPLVHLIPMSEKKLKLQHHFISDAEYTKMLTKEQKAIKYTNSRQVKNKCPF
jgi:hypothetical protein